MDDYASMQGLAQVLQRPNTGNLFALSQIKMRQEAQQIENAQKQQQRESEDFKTQIKLGEMPVLDTNLTQFLDSAKKSTLSSLQSIYENGYKNGFTPEHRRAASEIKQTYQSAEDNAQAFQQTVGQLKDTLNKSLPILKDDATLVNKYNDLNKTSFIKNPDGSLTLNKEALVKLNELPNDASIYDPTKMADVLVKRLGNISKDIYSPDANLSDQQKYSNVFLTDKNGRLVPDPKTGRPLINTSPEAIAQWNSNGDVWENVLKKHADDHFNGNVQKAFGSLMGSVADYSSVKTKINSLDTGRSSTSSINIVPQGEPTFKQDITGNETEPIGTVGPTLNLQNVFPDKALTVTLDNGKGTKSRVNVIGLAPGSDGTKKIIANEYDAKGKLIDTPSELPMTDANLQALIPAEMKGQTRAELTKAINEFKKGDVTKVYNDPAKINNAISGIQKAFKNPDAGIFSSSNVDSEVAAENVKDILINQLGIDKIKVKNAGGHWINKDINITANSGNFGNPNGNSLNINGTNFNLSDDNDVKKLKALIVNNATTKLTTTNKPENSNPEQTIAEKMKQAAGN